MRKPLSPLQALQADATAAAARHVDLDAVLADWVDAAQLSCDLAASYGALATVPDRLADVLADHTLLTTSDRRPTMIHDGATPPVGALGIVAERLRVHAEAMEQHGCFELALTTVAAVCRLTARTDPTGNALATLHLGRIARQMNALDAAEDAYNSAIGRALQLREPPIAARGYIGLALIADMRGNLPAAAAHYQEALALAVPRGGAHVQALQGLMSIAVGRGDLGEALVLGWTIYDASAEDLDARCAALSELGIVALMAGFPASARTGFRAVLSQTADPRIRLSTLAGDVRAAAQLRDRDTVRSLEHAIRREAAVGRAMHETTMAFVHLAEAQHMVGDVSAAMASLEEARALAERYAFNEYAFAADALERGWRTAEATVAAPANPPVLESDSLTFAIERFAALG